MKRPKNNIGFDPSECSDSKGRVLDSKTLQRKSLKNLGHCKTAPSQLAHDLKDHLSPKSTELSSSHLAELEYQRERKVMPMHGHLTNAPCNGVCQTGSSLQSAMVRGYDKEEMEQGDGVMEIEDQSEGASQEDCEAVSALLASQENEQLVSLETACVLLHGSPLECEGVEGEQEIPTGVPEVRTSELSCPEVNKPSCDSAEGVEEKVVLPHFHTMLHNTKVDAVKVVMSSQSPEATSPKHDAVLVSEITHKSTVHLSPCSSLEVISKPTKVTEVTRLKCSVSPPADRIDESPLLSKSSTDKIDIGFKSSHGSKTNPNPTLYQPNAPSPSTTDAKAQSKTHPQNIAHKPNHTSTVDKPTKSPLIIDRNEPFTVYRDPALVRRELENLSTYVPPPHTPPNLHSKHHLKSPSPSSSSPSLTSTNSHTKIISPAAQLSPLPLPSQSPLCPTHPSIPHPHLLPSLLPGLPQSSPLLAGHARLGALSLSHHPLALQATPSLLSQGPGTSSLAPIGLYPVLWPPFPNGVHGYSLGIPGSKWTSPETASVSEASLRRVSVHSRPFTNALKSMSNSMTY